ncbi:SMP-30/gluconolactonase/LRE family protein [Kiloniella antarctica]|uniref:SMP-30/gluconolactonase/LRE family protein n=1 Tax=Kiloniella antarctica TaxID=1550907 RepID=A0ABW5BK73_9PROT
MEQGYKIEKIWIGPALLGESPLWDHRENCLYWLDIENALLYRQNGDGSNQGAISLPAPAGSIALWQEGGLIAALGQGLSHIDTKSGIVTPLVPSLEIDQCLMNDGKADRAGNFIFGAKHLLESSAIAGSWRYQAGEIIQGNQKFVVFNGPAFSPKGDRIYFADSPSQKIMTATYSPDDGITSRPEIFTQLSEDDGYPDGMTVDQEGCLWNAQWDGWGLTRYRPDGTVERKIDMPVRRPTSLCFGGADFKTLFITSASTRITPEELAQNPDAGALFKIDLDIAGIAENIINSIN